MTLRWSCVLLTIAACERAPATVNESPPPPTPIVPTPTPPITPQPFYPVDPGKEKLYDVITFRLTATELSANGIQLLSLTATTEPDAIERAANAALSPPQLPRDTHIMLMSDKESPYARVIAVMKGAERAGYTKFAISTAP